LPLPVSGLSVSLGFLGVVGDEAREVLSGDPEDEVAYYPLERLAVLGP
jgi:hypothetical protein